MQSFERQIVGGREVEYLPLAKAERWHGDIAYQVWAVLPDGRHVYVAQTHNREWAARFVRMVPASSDAGAIGVVIAETNGPTSQAKKPAKNDVVPAWCEPRQARLQRQKGGRIDWASYGDEE